jgi:hypothetical protein
MFGKHGSDVIKRGQIINIIIIHMEVNNGLLTLPFKRRNLAVIRIQYEKLNQLQVVPGAVYQAFLPSAQTFSVYVMSMHNQLTKLNLAPLEAQEFTGDKKISLMSYFLMCIVIKAWYLMVM